MAENGPPPTAAQLPPPPQPNAGAPGFENNQNGQSNPAHMPPPPLHIPQNTNPIPTAMTSPLSGDQSGMMSPNSGGPFPRRAAPEPNKRALYVGGLDPRVTEDVLRQIFETTGHVQNVKIIPDKNVSVNSRSCVATSMANELSSRFSMSSMYRAPTNCKYPAKGIQLWFR